MFLLFCAAALQTNYMDFVSTRLNCYLEPLITPLRPPKFDSRLASLWQPQPCLSGDLIEASQNKTSRVSEGYFLIIARATEGCAT